MVQKAKQLHETLLDIEEHLLQFDAYPQSIQVAFEQKLNELSALLQGEQVAPEEPASRRPGEISGKVLIWSDGACSGNPGPGGWGCIVQSQGHYQEFSGFQANTTNNIMEMTGALEGLKMTSLGADVTVTTDSQYLVKGMTEWIHGWKKRGWKKADGNPVLNMALWKELDQVVRDRHVSWKWIKGHAGHVENERCDELAREAISNGR